MDQKKLNEIIEKHGKWLLGEEGGDRANLTDANLTDANLTDANLADANLASCSGNRGEIKSLFVSEVYAITYTAEVLQIGCQRHAISDWWKFDDQKIIGMDGKKALKFWREWKDTIRMIIEMSPAKATGHEG